MKQKWPIFLALLLFMSTSACNAVLSEQVRSTANEETLFEEIFEDPKQHVGKIIILGGEVLRLPDIKGSKRRWSSQKFPSTGPASRLWASIRESTFS
ncbi:MAG: hypothetical protein MPW15_10255 [Candidatus Manganitrophus sp.]|nr:hypothetical protein [Candidatus Manganitrophus sp.]